MPCLVVSLLQDELFSWLLHCFVGCARGLIVSSVRYCIYLQFTARV